MEIVLVKEEKERKRENGPALRESEKEKQRNHVLSHSNRAVLMNRGEGVTQITAHRTIILREQIARCI